MKRIAQVEANHNMYVDTQKKNHIENTLLLTKISDDLLEVGRTTKRMSTRQRIIENTLGISKIEVDENLLCADCTNDFLDLVRKDKYEVLGFGFNNCIYVDDRTSFTQQLEIVKKEVRENDFYIRITESDGFRKFHVKITPFICIKQQFIGASITFKRI